MRKKYHELDDRDLARIVHEAHLALRIGLNDSADDMHFDALPEERKKLVENQVRMFREGKTVAEVHDEWVRWMKERDWRQGLVRNLIQKTHPDMVPYDDLSPEAQAKIRQAERIVFTHVLPDALQEIAYNDIRTRPHIDGTPEIEEMPGVCVTHRNFWPCRNIMPACEFSDDAIEIEKVYQSYER